MNELAQRIMQAEATETDAVVNALRKRYSELFPDWELYILSMNKEKDRTEQLDQIIRFAEKRRTK